jgi:hypothetical protein
MGRKRKAENSSNFPVFEVNGEYLNIFQLLRRANYQGAALQCDDSEHYGFGQWSLLSRGTQRCMLEASEKYLIDLKARQPIGDVVSDVVSHDEQPQHPQRATDVSVDFDLGSHQLEEEDAHPTADVVGGVVPTHDVVGAGQEATEHIADLHGGAFGLYDPSCFNELDDNDVFVLGDVAHQRAANIELLGDVDDVTRGAGLNTDVDSIGGSDRRRLKFSEAFLDFVCRMNIAKAPAMKWINDMRAENVDFDVSEMPRTWKTLTKPTTEDDFEFLQRPIQVFTYPGKKAKVIHFGLIRTLRKHLPYIMKATFPKGNGPKIPHLRIELWTDGVELCNYGSENDLWPIAMTVVSIGAQHDGEHVFVPPWARKVLMLSLYLGSHKPSQPAPIFREVVDELKLLDPRERFDDRPTYLGNLNVREEFTASIIRFVADHPARCFVKNILGCQSHSLCEKCTNFGERVHLISGMVIWQVTGLNLRTDELFLTYPRHTKQV